MHSYFFLSLNIYLYQQISFILVSTYLSFLTSCILHRFQSCTHTVYTLYRPVRAVPTNQRWESIESLTLPLAIIPFGRLFIIRLFLLRALIIFYFIFFIFALCFFFFFFLVWPGDKTPHTLIMYHTHCYKTLNLHIIAESILEL